MRRAAATTTVLALALATSACATRPPEIRGSATYSITEATIAPSFARVTAFSDALDAQLETGGGTGRPARVEASVGAYRTDAPFVGLFYGGRHHASISGTIIDGTTGVPLDDFTIHVADDGDTDGADQRLASRASTILRARAALLSVPRLRTERVDVAAIDAPVPEAAPRTGPQEVSVTLRGPQPTPDELNLEPLEDDAVDTQSASAPIDPIVLQLPSLPTPPGTFGETPANDASSDGPCVIGPTGECVTIE